MKVALVGYGDLGHYMKDVLNEFYAVADIAYFDDNLYADSAINAYPFIDYMDDIFSDYHFYVCLGYKHLKLKVKIIDDLLSANRNVPVFIHQSSYVHPTVKIGSGSFIYPGCSIDRNTIIGKGSWIANGDVVAHDCKIGDGCWFGASVTLSGKVSVANYTFIGSGSVVANDLSIGSNIIVGMGTVITKNIDDGLSVIGSPMRILNKPLKLN